MQKPPQTRHQIQVQLDEGAAEGTCSNFVPTGNTDDSFSAHLKFHVMDGSDQVRSRGLPFT